MPKQCMAVQRSMQGTNPVLKMMLRRRLTEYRRCSSRSCSSQARAPGQGVLQGPAGVPHCLEVMLHLHLPAKGWAAPLLESLKAGHKGILYYSHPLPESFVSQGDLELLWAAVCYRKKKMSGKYCSSWKLLWSFSIQGGRQQEELQSPHGCCVVLCKEVHLPVCIEFVTCKLHPVPHFYTRNPSLAMPFREEKAFISL